jgi:hypothetical protein
MRRYHALMGASLRSPPGLPMRERIRIASRASLAVHGGIVRERRLSWRQQTE